MANGFYNFGQAYATALQGKARRESAENIAEAQRKAVAKNLSTQLAQQERLQDERLAHNIGLSDIREAGAAARLTTQIQAAQTQNRDRIEANKILGASKNISDFNRTMVGINENYATKFGQGLPESWQYDKQGRILPLGNKAYGGKFGAGFGEGDPFDRGLDTVDPVPLTKEAMNVQTFPAAVVKNVNSIVDELRTYDEGGNKRVTGLQDTKTGTPIRMGGGSYFNYKTKPQVKGQDLVETLKAREPKEITAAFRVLDNVKNRNKGIVNKESKRKVTKAMTAIGGYYQGMMGVFANPESELDINNKVRNKVAKYYIDRLVETNDLAESFDIMVPTWGSTRPSEVIDRP